MFLLSDVKPTTAAVKFSVHIGENFISVILPICVDQQILENFIESYNH